MHICDNVIFCCNKNLLLQVSQQWKIKVDANDFWIDHKLPLVWTYVPWSGILGSARTCLHAVMSSLCRGVDTHQGPSCVRSAPQFAELAYRLIYILCADHETSSPVLRYLRTHDFLYRHGQHLPFAIRATGMLEMFSQRMWTITCQWSTV